LKEKQAEFDTIKKEIKTVTKEFNAKTQAMKKRQAVIQRGNKLLNDLIKASDKSEL